MRKWDILFLSGFGGSNPLPRIFTVQLRNKNKYKPIKAIPIIIETRIISLLSMLSSIGYAGYINVIAIFKNRPLIQRYSAPVA